MHFTVYDVFYSQFSCQNVSVTVAAILHCHHTPNCYIQNFKLPACSFRLIAASGKETNSLCSAILTIYIIQITFLLTAWSTAVLEKLTGVQLVKKFLAFYGI
jgi:hypothetical protein